MTANSGSSSNEDKSASDAHSEPDPVKKTLLEVDASELLEPISEPLTQRTLLESNLPSLNQINDSLSPGKANDEKQHDPQRSQAEHAKEQPRRVAKTLQDSPNQSASNLKALQAPQALHDPQALQDPRALQDPQTLQGPRALQAPQALHEPQALQDPSKDSSSKSKSKQLDAETKIKTEQKRERERAGADFAKPDIAAMQAAQKKIDADKSVRSATSASAKAPPRAMSKQNIKLVKARKISNTMADLGYQMQAMEPLNENLSVGPSLSVGLDFDQSSEPNNLVSSSSKGLDNSVDGKANQTNKRLEYVPKTMLDHNMLFKAVSNSAIREEAKVAAIIEERAKLPPKSKPAPIKADRQSSPCPFKWEGADADAKYKYCSKCQLPIYNLDGIEKSEADALIFKRENKTKFSLYGREDGKFTTSDCPEKSQQQKKLVMVSLLAIALISGAVALLLFLPQQQPIEPPSNLQPSDTTTRITKRKQPSTTGGGNRYQTFKFPDAAQSGGTDSSGKPHVYDPDEDGSFWKFDNSP